jgi:tRNA(ile)-lysidine synthase
MFLKRFDSFIKSQTALDKGDKLLVAVSGGIDSVVLLDMLSKSGYRCAIAHCNFHLRASESDTDQTFVEGLARKYDIPIFIEHFDTIDIAAKEKISIEMAARNLRYRWFDEIKARHGFRAIAVAHHKNDNAETVLLNLTRGTGLRGLAGMQVERNDIVRPLLCFDRTEIEFYAKMNSLDFRIDSTNSDTAFHRNRVRCNILPQFEAINPDFVSRIDDFTRIMADYADFVDVEIEKYLREIVEFRRDRTEIDALALQNSRFARIVLFEVTKRLGFPPSFVDRIYQLSYRQTGRQIVYNDKIVLKNRDKILIVDNKHSDAMSYTINRGLSHTDKPIYLRFEEMDITELNSFKCDKNVALLDSDKLSFPLVVRLWQCGDRFRPLGMKCFQKVSDFLINHKIDIAEKQKTFVVLDANDRVVWLVNNRIDDRFKIDDSTQRVFKIECIGDCNVM